MKLVDCETGSLVPAKNNQYVALSYLWGAYSGTVEYSESLPKDLPATIQDSITGTCQLGFRYLWIDRYCINQNSQEELSAQLRKMDLIYQNTQVTIITVGGKDLTYGLPGVSKRHRTKQDMHR